jgi:hypothetical protein
MGSRALRTLFLVLSLVSLTVWANAQSFRVQCPTTTITHPDPGITGDTGADANSVEPAYTGPTRFNAGTGGYMVPVSGTVNGAIKCQQISGGDGYSTMGDGAQTYMFSFGPLSGLADIAAGKPGTQFPNVFNTIYPGTLQPGDPAVTDGATTTSASSSAFTYNGAVGLTPDLDALGDGLCTSPCLDGHVDPRPIMDVGVMNGNIPAPLMAIDEDDEFFLTLTNVGMIMRPDLFEQHTVHFHGYPNASSFYDGVPDASVAINIGGSFTYYYLAPDAGTYFWHCHITPPEHLQMGMVGQIYVRPRQNRVPIGKSLYTALAMQNGIEASVTTPKDLRTVCNPSADILCASSLPAVNTGAVQLNDEVGSIASNPNYGQPQKFAYNDGDGSTAYDVDIRSRSMASIRISTSSG